MSDTQVLVEIARYLQLIVCLIYGVQKIKENHTDVDPSSVANEAWRPRCRFGVPSTNQYCVQRSLHVACYKLRACQCLVVSNNVKV